MAQFNIIEEEEQKERLLQELYQLTDEYNRFVTDMDKKFDSVISRMESLHESDGIQSVTDI